MREALPVEELQPVTQAMSPVVVVPSPGPRAEPTSPAGAIQAVSLTADVEMPAAPAGAGSGAQSLYMGGYRQCAGGEKVVAV